ncbi:MAG: ABC transporter ATP-binding protein/permease [Cellulomonadaceae bacterium]|jgi:ATP-binding cassette subfamily B protein|nr:ABC transporter ATP-binding protein/permease [Cellulomonadaceae bacterium]
MLFKLARTYLRPYFGAVALLMVLQLVQTLASLYLPSLNAAIIDNGVTQGDVGYIWSTGGRMLIVSIAQVICSIIAVFLGARAAMSFGRDLRHDLFDKVQAFSERDVGKFGAPSLITRTTNDVQQVQMVVFMFFTIMIMAPMMLIGGLIMAMREDVELSALLLVIVPVLGISMGLIMWRMMPYFQSMQGKIDNINGVLREQITGMRVIRAFVRERTEEERFDLANTDLFKTQLATGRLMALAFPVVMLVMNLSSVSVIWFGGHRIDSGDMQIGQMTAFLTYLMYILMAVMMSTMMMIMVPRAAVAADRIGAVFDRKISVVEPSNPPALASFSNGNGPTGKLRFDNVEFRYPGADAPVLSDVSFTAAPGTTTAIIGSTGSGKTTLLGLIPRLADATAGDIFVDDINIKDMATADLCSIIGLVPQKAYLFSGTVASNLQFGKHDATDDQMWQALEVAQAKDFIEALPDKLEAEVAQGGTTFSGGQRQRLAISRAVVREPKIYLFDDSFSALDYSTDAKLRAALKPRTRDAVVIVVAQRVSTIKDADNILVLEHGRIVGEGTHQELLDGNETYQEIVSSQMSLEEAQQ